jgi:hypothetical protein
MSKDTSLEPEQIVDNVNKAYEFYKGNKDTPRFKEWKKKEIIMYSLMNNEDLRDKQVPNYTTSARRIGDLIFGFGDIKGNDDYPVEFNINRRTWKPDGR